MPEEIDDSEIIASIPGWHLTALSEAAGCKDYELGQVMPVEARDSVTSAPEIVRMTLNMAMTHTDSSKGVYEKRLVYGGHTISIAAAQMSRVVPDLASILAVALDWHLTRAACGYDPMMAQSVVFSRRNLQSRPHEHAEDLFQVKSPRITMNPG